MADISNIQIKGENGQSQIYQIKDSIARNQMTFATVADMKQSLLLENNTFVSTLGFHEIGDGGKASYYITNTSQTANEYDIIELQNNLFAILVYTKEINQMQFGCFGDGNNDDTEAIQALFTYCYNNNVKDINFVSNKIHKISSTINITASNSSTSTTNINYKSALDIHINFANCKFNCYSGTYTNNTFINLSGTSGTGIYYINNLLAQNFDKINNLILLYTNTHLVANYINSIYFYQTIVTGTNYIDVFKLTNVRIDAPLGQNYMILKNGNGDQVEIESCSYINYSDTSNHNFIQLRYCASGKIKNCLQGGILLTVCDNITIENCHFEIAPIILNNSQCVINNCQFWKSNMPDFCIQLQDYNSQKVTAINKPVTVKNCEFILDYAKSSFNTETYDIDSSQFSGLILLENNIRKTQASGSNIEYTVCSGINIKKANDVIMYTIDNTCIIENDNIISNTRMIPETTDQNGYFNLINVQTSKAPMPSWQISSGTYYYNVYYIFDDVRKLGLGRNNISKNISISNVAQVIRLNLQNNYMPAICRIYRGTAQTNMINYVDVPFVQNRVLYDNGNSINGYIWKQTSETTMPQLNYCWGYQKINETNIIAYCSGIPSEGIWQNGDIVYNVGTSQNNTLGWIYLNNSWQTISV